MLPKEATNHIDKKAIELLNKLEVKPRNQKGSKEQDESSLDHRPTVTLKDEEIQDRISSTVDQEGKPLSFHFLSNENEVGLTGDNHKAYYEFVKSLGERKEFRSIISVEKINEVLINWFRISYLEQKLPTASEYILEELNRSINRYIIRFPIQNLAISKNFLVGKVHFSYFKRDEFTKMENQFHKIHGPERKSPFDELRKHFQGHVTADVIFQAESRKAIELGLAEVKKSLAVLRYFSPSALNPKSNTLFCLHQLDHTPSYHIFTFKENEILPFYTILPKFSAPYYWSINKKEIKRIDDAGMFHFDQLLKEKNLSDFDEILINGLFLFEKALLAEEPQEKLVYFITCLETLLLKDTNESIKKSVGQRLAFLISDNREERKRIIEFLSEAHKNRSSFIHHGRVKKINDEVMIHTQLSLWLAMRKMTENRKRFSEKTEFIDFIDDAILSGELSL